MASATTFYDFKPLDKKGEPFPLAELQGKVVLVVNTASKCGFTPQFEGLEKLYKEMKQKHGGTSLPNHPGQPNTSFSEYIKLTPPVPGKFTILGFPCNQFGSQDPGSNDEIQSFCQVNYGVTFPVLGKIDVNGAKADPVYDWLKSQQSGMLGLKMVKWNFEKFLVGVDGKVKGRWASTTKPETLRDAIEKELAVVEKPVA
jgi:peroxiredoxin